MFRLNMSECVSFLFVAVRTLSTIPDKFIVFISDGFHLGLYLSIKI